MEKVIDIKYHKADIGKLEKKIFKYINNAKEHVTEDGVQKLLDSAPVWHNLRIATDKSKECFYQLAIKAIFNDIRMTKKRVEIFKTNLEKYKEKIIGLEFDYNNGNPNTFIMQIREILLDMEEVNG